MKVFRLIRAIDTWVGFFKSRSEMHLSLADSCIYCLPDGGRFCNIIALFSPKVYLTMCVAPLPHRILARTTIPQEIENDGCSPGQAIRSRLLVLHKRFEEYLSILSTSSSKLTPYPAFFMPSSYVLHILKKTIKLSSVIWLGSRSTEPPSITWASSRHSNDRQAAESFFSARGDDG